MTIENTAARTRRRGCHFIAVRIHTPRADGPHLFGTIIAEVPLLDMRTFHALLAVASWTAEYGNLDNPEDWAYLSQYSPYHNVQPGQKYPPLLLITSTRDDRVHPGHARKMAARLTEHGYDVTYYENTDGGHAAAADHQQQAHNDALKIQFLWQTLATQG
ncbi:prolyl oligopeptidase family serine peptidase [Hamadaea sp. NPDC050747]|uniref:prolyl oligopeptidase family serine peptidase n=1 Tax=Hamadaea sp. NPDC050747 TaxID=3155789 RepID=UPI0033E893B4